MNRKVTKLGSLAVTALFSCAALAQVAVKPRPAETVVRPGATAVQVRPNIQTQALQNKFEKAGQPTQVESQAQGQSCSVEELASKLITDTGVSYANALAALKFWGSSITVGTCGSAEGLVGYNAQARENFLEAAVNGMNILNGRKVTGEEAKKVWADSLAFAKNNDGGEKTTAAAEVATVEALQKNCNILRLF